MGQNDYLAHSKGPWKKHKYIKKVGNKYYYAGSKGYYRALATTNDDSYSDSEKKAARRINARNANEANLKRASRKQRVKNVGVSARLNAQKAGKAASEVASKVSGAAKRTGANAKNKAYSSKYLVKAYGDKAGFAAKDAKRAVGKALNSKTGKAIRRKGESVYKNAVQKSSRAARNARRSVSAAASYGKSAISKLFTNAKGRARLVRANASAAAIKRKQAKRAKARKKA